MIENHHYLYEEVKSCDRMDARTNDHHNPALDENKDKEI
jgi:hypothetical protein